MTRLPVYLVALTISLGAAALGQSAAVPEFTKTEIHLLRTTTLTDEQFLTGSRNGTPVAIGAELRLPAAARTQRVPAMVSVHGSSGLGVPDDRWARELVGMGIATLRIDGFTGRGIVGVANDQSQLGSLTMINDAYRALELLAKDSRIDPMRIGIIGFSRGGRIALYASLERFRRTYAAPGTAFAVYLPFYAGCGTTYIDDTAVADRPIRLFHGTADDTAPIAACRTYVERLRRAGKDVQLTEYEGAHHAFDYPGIPLTHSPQVQAQRSCPLVEGPPGQIVNQDTKRPFTWGDACVTRGGTVAYDAIAHADALTKVGSLLRQVFKLDPR